MQFSRCLVGSSGLEPPTSRLSGVRSNLLSYEPSFQTIRTSLGGDERVRTDDPLLAKQVLSQLSYTPTVYRLSSCALLKVLTHLQNYTVLFNKLRNSLFTK